MTGNRNICSLLHKGFEYCSSELSLFAYLGFLNETLAKSCSTGNSIMTARVAIQMSSVCGIMVILNDFNSYLIHWLRSDFFLLIGVEIYLGPFVHQFFGCDISPLQLCGKCNQERLLWHGTSWECVPNIVCLRLQFLDARDDDVLEIYDLFYCTCSGGLCQW